MHIRGREGGNYQLLNNFYHLTHFMGRACGLPPLGFFSAWFPAPVFGRRSVSTSSTATTAALGGKALLSGPASSATALLLFLAASRTAGFPRSRLLTFTLGCTTPKKSYNAIQLGVKPLNKKFWYDFSVPAGYESYRNFAERVKS